MNTHDLVNRLLETDPDEVDPKHYVRMARPQQRQRFLKGERVMLNKRGWPREKATVVTTTDDPDSVWIHVDGFEPGDNLYFYAAELEPLVESRLF
jgi:hypothetical protein